MIKGLGSCMVTGRSYYRIFTIAIYLSQILTLVVANCRRLEICTHIYQTNLKGGEIQRGPTPQYCSILRTYHKCLKGTGRACRGDLQYHTMQSLTDQWLSEFECDNVIEEEPRSLEPILPAHLNPVEQVCHWEGSDKTVFCSVFGDPHVITFDRRFQTCSSIGAWPLVDNQYLAVSVTNEPLVPGSPASAISKVTVILKSTSDCSPERTYEASIDYLPNMFIDGSDAAGEGEIIKVVEHDPGRFVEITARHLAIVVYIRQIGRHLSIAISMPSDLLETGVEGLYLCSQGCPTSQRLDQRRNEVFRLPREAAFAACRDYNVTDVFLDACVFDVSTTNDAMFTLVAKVAQSDYMQLSNNELIKGRTSLLPRLKNKVDRDVAYSSVEYSGPGRPLMFFCVFITFIINSIYCVYF
ncbi:repulsive guidance molecule A-like [Artemia franciscana]|uniref:Repulsive guidance molecule A n=1 Tax=Artemia franciscana TaxID=6661 RepID=A0AA88LDR2_ARTSF|nr:hypothetical protein QYM36_003409 [Artemia franciscana]KAK2721122.1 hypothetical protein QYM36_003409 [Artemia franciscana]